ncbi:MAG: hypothetical protein M1817_000001, partial [Caeruleum heppii]
LFEAALKRRKTFERLGRLDKDMSWGRLRAEKWKRSVSSVLQLWEGWCVFPQASQEHFAAVFADPPLTDQEQRALKAAESSSVALGTAKSKWKAVDVTPDAGEDMSRPLDLGARPASQTNGDSEDVDGEEMVEEDENLDGEPMEDDDLDGEPMEDGMDAEPMEIDSETVHPSAGLSDAETLKTASAVREAFNARIKAALSVGKEGEDMRDGLNGTEPPTNGSSESHGEIRKRRRPKAEDMFADSDED